VEEEEEVVVEEEEEEEEEARPPSPLRVWLSASRAFSCHRSATHQFQQRLAVCFCQRLS
jgi:hypothetical protein